MRLSEDDEKKMSPTRFERMTFWKFLFWNQTRYRCATGSLVVKTEISFCNMKCETKLTLLVLKMRALRTPSGSEATLEVLSSNQSGQLSRNFDHSFRTRSETVTYNKMTSSNDFDSAWPGNDPGAPWFDRLLNYSYYVIPNSS